MSERCIRCGQPASGKVPIYSAIPLNRMRQGDTDYTGRTCVRVERVNGLPFCVLRDDPWCRDCGESTLRAMGDTEYVWWNAETGWPVL